MQIRFIYFKSSLSKPLESLIEDYQGRLKKYVKISEMELNCLSDHKYSLMELQRRESDIVLNKISSLNLIGNSFLIVLTERGDNLSSEKMAEKINNFMNNGISNLIIIIGGPYGTSLELESKAQLKLSLSKMTFTAQMARLILYEQLYRSFAIINNLPYHKGEV